MKTFERRYHAYWVLKNGPSALSKLGAWLTEHHASLQTAPRDLLVAAAADVARRLPEVAVREPSRRHRKHFAWLLEWHQHLIEVLGHDDNTIAECRAQLDGHASCYSCNATEAMLRAVTR